MGGLEGLANKLATCPLLQIVQTGLKFQKGDVRLADSGKSVLADYAVVLFDC